MNLSEMADTVYKRMGVPVDDGTLTGDVVRDFLRTAVHAIEVDRDWDWLRTSENIAVVAGTDTYTPATNWSKSLSCRLSIEREPMVYVTPDDADTYLGGTTPNRAQPLVWTLYGGSLIIRPVPDTTYTLVHRYVRQEVDLTSDGQSPLMPARFHDAIIDLAQSYAWSRLKDDGRAGAAMQRYGVWRDRMADDQIRVAHPLAIRVRDRV